MDKKILKFLFSSNFAKLLEMRVKLFFLDIKRLEEKFDSPKQVGNCHGFWRL